MGHQATAEFTEDGGIKAGIGQLQGERVFPINAPAHGLGGLPVAEAFLKLKHRHQRQAPGGLRWLTMRWIQIGE